MVIFKTRKEVKKLQDDVQFLTDMIRTHFDIKYTMKDFEDFCRYRGIETKIPVSVGEFLRYHKMLAPLKKSLSYDGHELEPKHNMSK